MGVGDIASTESTGVFLDRDGTLNRAFERDGSSVPPSSLDELRILPGVPEALLALKARGLRLVVVTNQPDVARGTTQRSEVERINRHLADCLPLDAVLCCYHDDADDCRCRKPQPGLLIDGARRLGLHLPSCFMVGDRWRDVEAGQRAGCTTVLLGTPLSGPTRTAPDFVVHDLAEATGVILRRLKERAREGIRR